MKKCRMNHKPMEGVCRVVRGEIQPVERRSTDWSLKDEVLLCLKTLDGAPFPKLLLVHAIDLHSASTIC